MEYKPILVKQCKQFEVCESAKNGVVSAVMYGITFII